MKNLQWYDPVVLALGIAVFAAVEFSKPDLPQIRTFGPEHTIWGGPPGESTAQARTAYLQRFLKGSYFGAFALAPGGAWGWSTENNSEEAARQNALAHCGQYDTACEVIAVLVPEGYDQAEGITLKLASAEIYRAYQLAAPAKAFAVSENGASSYSYEYETQAEAEAAALEDCETRRKKGQPDFLPDWPCILVDSSWY